MAHSKHCCYRHEGCARVHPPVLSIDGGPVPIHNHCESQMTYSGWRKSCTTQESPKIASIGVMLTSY